MTRKTMDIKEFREFGYLQEVNRQFFHPLGLALEVRRNEDGTEELSGIWDCRDDPEGVFYELTDMDEVAAKIQRVRSEQMARESARLNKFGWVIQLFKTERR